MSKTKLKYDWYIEADTIMKANFTIQNDSEHSAKDFEIRCTHSAPSGTVIDSNTRTIYEIVKPHSKRRFANFTMGFINSQAASSSCHITSLALVQ